jgi:hypothetical protein
MQRQIGNFTPDPNIFEEQIIFYQAFQGVCQLGDRDVPAAQKLNSFK